MGTNTEELRREIEQTRTGLGDTLDAIGDRVSPSRVIERRKNRVTGAFRNARERVMGVSADAGHAIGGTAENAMQSVHDAPQAVRSQAQGSPMAAGAIAFGMGFIAAAAFPPSRTEQQMAGNLTDRIEPLKQEASSAAREMVDHLKEPAMDALGSVKETAAEGAHALQDTAKDAAQQTKEQGQQAVKPN
ncbi:MAG: hypothetical protein JWN99_1124 [Ilumatobacteraceae bacterium]|nr:hypothetical protein [Ilumatobacteraceae bacterium]